jgi:aminopeptidase N
VDGALYDFNLFRPYRDAIYLNGAKFMEDLRNLIGDQAFFAFLKDYASSEKYKIANADDFFTILRRHTSENLDGLIEDYFQNSH